MKLMTVEELREHGYHFQFTASQYSVIYVPPLDWSIPSHLLDSFKYTSRLGNIFTYQSADSAPRPVERKHETILAGQMPYSYPDSKQPFYERNSRVAPMRIEQLCIKAAMADLVKRKLLK